MNSIFNSPSFPIPAPDSALNVRANTLQRFGLLFLLLLVFLTFCLGQRGLSEPDEGRYSGIALEMLEPDANWWEPQMSDFGHYDKPPLIYWATALSFELFGKSEFAARLPSFCGAMLALAGLCWAAWRLYGRELAWWSVLICGTLGQFWLLARYLSPDMLLAGWCSLAVGAWAESRHRDGHRGFWSLSLLFWVLAWWTKATPALVPFLGLATAVWLGGDVVGRRALRPVRTLCGILILGSPWYLLMMHRHPDLVHFFFGHELVGRIVGDEHGRHKPFYFFLLSSWFLWLPWLPLLAILSFWKRNNFAKPSWEAVRKKVGWDGWIVFAGLVIFSLNSSKLLTYTLPLAPWAALFLARILFHLKPCLTESAFRRIAIGAPAVMIFCAITAVLAWPKFEGRLGHNSSIRPAALRLQAKGARVVLLDRFWPGTEFYLGEHVYYIGKKGPQQSSSDTGFCREIAEPHFCTPEECAEKVKTFSGPVWLVHYRRDKSAAFARLEKEFHFAETETVGDFELVRLN